MKRSLSLALIITALSASVSGQTPQDPDRQNLLDELSVRLQAQLVELPNGIYIRGTGVYEKIGGKGAASAYVNTAGKAPGEAFLNTETNEAGVFTESASSISFEGLQRETPAGTGSMFEMTSSDFYKPRTSAGWFRLGHKQLNKSTKPTSYSHVEMERTAGYGTVGAGPLATQRTLTQHGVFDAIVNRVEKHLELYRVEATRDASLTTFTMTWTVPVDDGYFQQVRFVFDDSRHGVLVYRGVNLSNPTTNHTKTSAETRCEYTASPAGLAEVGIPYILTRSHYVEKAATGPGAELSHIRTYDFRFSGIEAIAGEPAPPEWYTKWQQAVEKSDEYKATLAAKGS